MIVHFTSILSVYGMVPHLTAVMGTMLPMLGMAKYENMRWVFSAGKTSFTTMRNYQSTVNNSFYSYWDLLIC